MSFKKFVISRLKLFFFLLPLTFTATVILRMIFAPQQKFTVDMMQTPLFTSVVGVLLSFITYFRKMPTFRQYLLRLLLQLILIHLFILWMVSLAEDAVIPPVPYYIIINIMIFVIYALGVLMIWFQKKRQSQKMSEQLRKLQERQMLQNQSDDSQSNVTKSREPVLK